MFTIEVHAEFAAAHALVIAGQREPVHGHNWHVTVTLSGDTLDDDGLLCDFHTVEAVLQNIIEPYHNNDLNRVEPFTETNPTAELVAKHIATELTARLGSPLTDLARVQSVRVTEAPGCSATYHAEPG